MYKSFFFAIAGLATVSFASDDVPTGKQSHNSKQQTVRVIVASSKAESSPAIAKHVEYVHAGANNRISGKNLTPKLPLKKVSHLKKPDEKDKRAEIDRSNQIPREKLINKLKKLMGVDESPTTIDYLEHQMYSMMHEATMLVMQEE